MSYDIIILKPADKHIGDLAAVDEVLSMGDEVSIIRSLERAFPGCTQGFFARDECFTLEASLSGTPVMSVHLSLRFGSGWSDSSSADFLGLLAPLCHELRACAFSVSDHARIAAPW